MPLSRTGQREFSCLLRMACYLKLTDSCFHTLSHIFRPQVTERMGSDIVNRGGEIGFNYLAFIFV